MSRTEQGFRKRAARRPPVASRRAGERDALEDHHLAGNSAHSPSSGGHNRPLLRDEALRRGIRGEGGDGEQGDVCTAVL
jgi:hypothetical protein